MSKTTYKAMPGTILIEIEERKKVSNSSSGLLIVENLDKGNTTIAEVIAVGDERDDIKVGSKILFPSSTGLKVEKNIFYLKYEDIVALVNYE